MLWNARRESVDRKTWNLERDNDFSSKVGVAAAQGIHLVKLSRCVLVYAEIGHGPTLATRGALHAHISLRTK